MLSAIRPARLLARALRQSSGQAFLQSRSTLPLRWSHPSLKSIHSTSVRLYNGAAQTIERGSPVPEPPRSTSEGPITTFSDLSAKGLVDPKVISTITNAMNIDTMTPVQSKTIGQTLNGIDTLAQAKTGTGKTLAFLVPVVQRILQQDPQLSDRYGRRTSRPSPSDIRALIVSPTRELAEQIASVANRVTQNTGIRVQCATGGTQKRQSLLQMQHQGCHLLIGTPGRLNDLLSDPGTGVRAPRLSTFVLDEADRLLDDGFLPDIKRMQSLLPEPTEVDRQTLLFSATLSDEIMNVVRATMKPDFQFVRTVSKDEVPTHNRVPQRLVVCRSLQNQLPTLYELCHRETQKSRAGEGKPFKAIVYFSATAEVVLAAETFRKLKLLERGQDPLYPARLFEIHSKLTQRQRTFTAENFRRARSAIMFSSDVTARGMDFPDVTHIIQVGLPTTRDSYIHRLGRTARAEKTGEGWMILSTIEQREYQRLLYGLPIEQDNSLLAASLDMTSDAQIPIYLAEVLNAVTEATKQVGREIKEKAYSVVLSLYARHSPNKQAIVDLLNEWARYGWGFSQPPAISQRFAWQLGYDRTHGLNIQSSRRSHDRFDDFGGRHGAPSDRYAPSPYGGRGQFSPRGDRGGRYQSFEDRDPYPRRGGYGLGGVRENYSKPQYDGYRE